MGRLVFSSLWATVSGQMKSHKHMHTECIWRDISCALAYCEFVVKPLCVLYKRGVVTRLSECNGQYVYMGYRRWRGDDVLFWCGDVTRHCDVTVKWWVSSGGSWSASGRAGADHFLFRAERSGAERRGLTDWLAGWLQRLTDASQMKSALQHLCMRLVNFSGVSTSIAKRRSSHVRTEFPRIACNMQLLRRSHITKPGRTNFYLRRRK